MITIKYMYCITNIVGDENLQGDMKMVEIKTYENTGTMTFTIVGGKRDTTYDNFQQAVKRMKNLCKKGKSIHRIVFEGNRVEIWMFEGNHVSTTPGYQRVEVGTKYVSQYMRYTGYLWGVNPTHRKI